MESKVLDTKTFMIVLWDDLPLEKVKFVLLVVAFPQEDSSYLVNLLKDLCWHWKYGHVTSGQAV